MDRDKSLLKNKNIIVKSKPALSNDKKTNNIKLILKNWSIILSFGSPYSLKVTYFKFMLLAIWMITFITLKCRFLNMYFSTYDPQILFIADCQEE